MLCKRSRILLFTETLAVIFIALTMIALPVSAQGQTEPTSYDPTIHIWREGMTPTGIMHSNVVTGTITVNHGEESSVITIPIFGDTTGVQFYIGESGSVTLPQDWKSTKRSPNQVRRSSCGEDYYIDYYSVPRGKLFSNALRVNTKNSIDWHWIRFVQQGRLHGRYVCHYHICTISVCLSNHANEPWALRLCWD